MSYSFNRLAKELGVSYYRLGYWHKKGVIEVKKVNGVKAVDDTVAEKLIRDWERSLEPGEFVPLAGIANTAGSLSYMIQKGIVETIVVSGQRRILKSSLGPARKYVAESKGETELLGLDETCRILGMLGWQVLKLYYEGRLPGKRIGDHYVFSKEEIESFAGIRNRPKGKNGSG